jgi:hypothetical protein
VGRGHVPRRRARGRPLEVVGSHLYHHAHQCRRPGKQLESARRGPAQPRRLHEREARRGAAISWPGYMLPPWTRR